MASRQKRGEVLADPPQGLCHPTLPSGGGDIDDEQDVSSQSLPFPGEISEHFESRFQRSAGAEVGIEIDDPDIIKQGVVVTVGDQLDEIVANPDRRFALVYHPALLDDVRIRVLARLPQLVFSPELPAGIDQVKHQILP